MNDKQVHFEVTTERKCSNIIVAVFALLAMGYVMQVDDEGRPDESVVGELAQRLGAMGYDEVMSEFAHLEPYNDYVEQADGTINFDEAVDTLARAFLVTTGGIETFKARMASRQKQIATDAADWRHSKLLNPSGEGTIKACMITLDELIGKVSKQPTSEDSIN